jgi:hypothetical protein
MREIASIHEVSAAAKMVDGFVVNVVGAGVSNSRGSPADFFVLRSLSLNGVYASNPSDWNCSTAGLEGYSSGIERRDNLSQSQR